MCCVFTLTTSGTVTENCTYVQNPSFPGRDTATSAGISYTVQRCSSGEPYQLFVIIHRVRYTTVPMSLAHTYTPDICTLRLDFEMFDIAGVTDTTEAGGGVCEDMFTVTVSSIL